MSNQQYEWKIFCETQNEWVTGISPTAPQTCFVDPTHTVDLASATLLANITPLTVVVAEQQGLITVSGRYGSMCFNMDVNPDVNSVSTEMYSFPYPISMLNVQIQVATSNVGDIMDCQIAPNTTIGVLTADANISDTTFTVNPTVIANAFLGAYINLVDGNGDNVNLGRLISMGTDTITTETPASAVIITGSFVQITRYMVRDCYLATPGQIKLGYGKIGGAYFPANVPGTVVYTNTIGGTKKISIIVEYLY